MSQTRAASARRPVLQSASPFPANPRGKPLQPDAALVRHQNRNTVSRLNRNQQPRLRRDRSIRLPRAFAVRIRRAAPQSQGSSETAAESQSVCRFIAGNSLRQQSAIPRNRLAIVGRRKPEIQFAWSILTAISPAHAAQPRAEPMPEPAADCLSDRATAAT